MFDLTKVIEGDFCSGCGACAFIENKSITMKSNKDGQFKPVIKTNYDGNLLEASKVCPFSNLSMNETEIGLNLYGKTNKANNYIGYYKNNYAGFVSETRKNSSSGGIITWLLKELLVTDLVDYVITVHQTSNKNSRFEYFVTNNVEEIFSAAGSVYYPVKMDEVIEIVKKQSGRYAFVGIPCFNKALRLLRAEDPIINERIAFQIGIVCGHLKTKHYSEFLIRKLGLNSNNVTSINFRKKNKDSIASNYLFEAKVKKNQNEEIFEIENRKIGDNWGMGLYKPNACDFCDDIFSETADIVAMDAWLPKYINDYRGHNLIITRNIEIDSILTTARNSNRIELENVEVEDIITSQIGGLRHRRRGLRYRLYTKIKKGKWVPNKRVLPSKDSDWTFRLLQKSRRFVSFSNKGIFKIQLSFEGLKLYTFIMYPILKVYFVMQKIHYRFGNRNKYE